ncbi:ImmA/IrrE family metallo-endopeptidase [Sandaracinus amylolyticus]|uniref:ImmA/IrrE family metallo-endopeptidase n=1 Tax=Sandaracinus amylolyticus TaxID=927083 RepID=UPI001F2DCDD4|nr:ImmA/IrrE family metallo-endopeptidase [Sandaracinus amylolyticus]UJR84195.1 Hypothetical protein I5071_62660 [Sandaracinus amylolyticus]
MTAAPPAWENCEALLGPTPDGSPVGDPLELATFWCPQYPEGAVELCPDAPQSCRRARPADEANRIPWNDLRERILSGRCDHLLTDVQMRAILGRIPTAPAPADCAAPCTPERIAMNAVFASVRRWAACPGPLYRGGGRVHGEYLDDDHAIVLYGSTCGASRIYGEPLLDVSVVHRMTLVMCHELGHAIQHAAGELRSLPARARETQASYFGSLLAQCLIDEYSEVIAAAAAPAVLTPSALSCFQRRWSTMSTALERLRSQQVVRWSRDAAAPVGWAGAACLE